MDKLTVVLEDPEGGGRRYVWDNVHTLFLDRVRVRCINCLIIRPLRLIGLRNMGDGNARHQSTCGWCRQLTIEQRKVVHMRARRRWREVYGQDYDTALDAVGNAHAEQQELL